MVNHLTSLLGASPASPDPSIAIMNGFAGVPATPAPLWQEARNNDGRVYYYNTQTKVTQWTKPLELMTPAEVRYQIGATMNRRLTEIACSFESAMARIYRRRRPQILVQQGDQGELLEDASRIPRGSCTDTASCKASHVVRWALKHSVGLLTKSQCSTVRRWRWQ